MPHRRKRLVRIAAAVATVAIVDYAVVHLLPGLSKAWTSAASGKPVLLALALALEVASVASYSMITTALLPRHPSTRYASALTIDVTGMGLSHVMPGGGASAAALRVRLMARRGIAPEDAVSAGAVEYAVTLLWLIALLLCGLVSAAPSTRTMPMVRAALVIVVVAVMVLGALIAVLVARPDEVVTVSQWVANRLPLVSAGVLERMARSLLAEVRLMIDNHARRSRCTLWALAYWGFDAASLSLCLIAFGPIPNPGGLLTTYAVANLLALLPITPGGLGLVEGVAVPALVSFGVDPAQALLGVLSWRLFAFWLPIPISLGTFTWLSVHKPERTRAAEVRSG